MSLKYIEVDSDNLDLAVKIQNAIFPLEDGRLNYIEGITNDPYRKEMTNYIVYDNGNPIGVVGLYSYNEYPNDAWLSWFGVLEEYRKKGYGSRIFDFFETLAREKGYTSIRVYTDDAFSKAISLYEKKSMIKEFYKNELESEEINNETIIYSKSLTTDKTRKWDNKFLGLTIQSEKEKS
ncbi:MAG: GNAT family N-acetyltransferase [Bacilli bacterium]|nr:GNAT family N-acetyltransferase [Bacilli bacterium]